jgi:hypothetical protein
MTDDGAGLISSWSDRIGGMTATATTTARPTWGATSFYSGIAGVTFDGVANTMASSTLTTLPTGTTPGEVWVVAAGPGTAIASVTASVSYGGTANGSFRQMRKSNADLLFMSDGTTNNVGGLVIDAKGPALVGATFEATVYTFHGNGVNAVPTTGATLNTGTTRLRIGANTAGSAGQFWSGPIRHVMVTTLLTADNRQKLEGWLAWDSGLVSLLSADHPYKGSPP